MTLPRAAGILLHPTSLPGPNGIGEFGEHAHRFVDVLADAGITIWQVLPLGPTGYGDSPYQTFSAFAGNPLLIAIESDGRVFPRSTVDFDTVIPHKRALLDRAIEKWTPDRGFRPFVESHASWLDDYALFMALKDEHGGAAWTTWERGAASREPAALARWRDKLASRIERYRIEQYLYFTQYNALRNACRARNIRIMGDLPIYVAHDSADVWADRSSFKLREDGRPLVQAGVPPDYFSATGQLWGNPIYDWDAMHADGYSWWIRRLRAAFESFDLIRIDHFRGFEAYWEVDGDAPTAIDGRWVEGPGAPLFAAMTKALGAMPIVAENLGVITPAVEALREQFEYPGMSILQFAFGLDPEAGQFRPHNFPRDRVVYTGTHDNDTTVGWWASSGQGDSTRASDEVAREKAFALQYLGADGHEMNWTLIRAALASVANTVIVPLQDVLGLGSDARMNLPGRASGNWRFRFSWDQLTPGVVHRLRTMVDTYDR
ncbi:MAG TPA: 4-alpha-glucanotransferase [Gemmatimonadaceae bacterium]|nr:4-alpha-glucanotransferase [Gemmatimonadaceae bacterium]